jgi:hypothetical protein
MSNTTTETLYFTYEDALQSIGSTILTDYLFLYPNAVIGPIGIVLNILCLAVLNQREFESNQLYQLLKVNSANSALVCFVSSFLFVSNSYRLVPGSNSQGPQWFTLYIHASLISTGYFYGSALDILVTLNCIGNFNHAVRRFLSITTTYKLCLITFTICLLINTPSFFQFTSLLKVFKFNATTDFVVWDSDQPSSFSLTTTGIVIHFIVYIFRDLVMAVALITVNLTSLWLMHRYFMNRAKLFNIHHCINTNQVHPYRSKAVTSNLLTSSARSSLRSGSVAARSDHRLAFMALFICSLSTIEHVFYMTSSMYAYFAENNSSLFNIIYFVANFFINLKHGSYFFILVLFNNNFRKQLVRMLSPQK